MEGKVSKDTWNMIRQIYITGRSSWKALKALPILPSREALGSGDQPANLLGGGARTADYSALELFGRNTSSYTSLASPVEKKTALQISSHRKTRSQQTTFPSAAGFQRDDRQDRKMKENCFKPVTCGTKWCSLAAFEWLPQMLAVFLPLKACCLH